MLLSTESMRFRDCTDANSLLPQLSTAFAPTRKMCHVCSVLSGTKQYVEGCPGQ